MKKHYFEKGFVTLIIIIIIGLALLQMLFHVQVAAFFGSDVFIGFLINLKQIVISLWDSITKVKAS